MEESLFRQVFAGGIGGVLSGIFTTIMYLVYGIFTYRRDREILKLHVKETCVLIAFLVFIALTGMYSLSLRIF